MEVATRPSHDGAPEYKCTYCDRIMNRKSNMKRHIASIHTKVKHSSCCNAHFTTTAALRLHQKTVHENGYVCPTCGRTFERKASLDRHIFTHTTEKPFKCESCPYNTCSKFNLKRHARLKHSALPQVPVPQPEIQVPVPQPRPEAPEENQQYSQAQEGPALALHQGMPDTRDIAHRPVAPHHAVEESLHPFREDQALVTTRYDIRHHSQALVTARYETHHPSQALVTTRYDTSHPSQTLVTARYETRHPSQALVTTRYETRHPSQTLVTTRYETRHLSQALVITRYETRQPSQAPATIGQRRVITPLGTSHSGLPHPQRS
ncbi:zinc finger protein ZFAT-like [Scylla paramamosain]|uniref:zinc finger protein ZFAT-like n=1 Tax=Scylla paramamosain TaxID=85552 RepID=UPI003083B93F